MEVNNIRSIDSIVKARDNNTYEYRKETEDTFLYSIMLSHIEHIESNLYNFKFIAKTLSPSVNKEIYLNLQLLVSDSSIIYNSKYYIEDPDRLKLVKSYKFEEKENGTNSYRVDFSIGNSYNNSNYCELELVNMVANSSTYIGISKEIFFKISIFLYQLLNLNIIDGNILFRKIESFRELYGKEAYLNLLELDIKLFRFFWNNNFIIAFIDPDNDHQIAYMVFSKKEYNEINDELASDED